MRFIGVMTGTSLDGVDLICVDFNQNGDLDYQVQASITYPYENEWVDQLKKAFTQDNKQLEVLSKEYGIYIGLQVLRFIDQFQLEDIEYIASHGYTVFHKPDLGITLQIGDGQEIANVTNINTVYDFRAQDVALGGQGAPLVPIGDELLFSDYDVCLNLGGFANLSFTESGVRKAFDICPINIVLNQYVSKLGFEYDDQGKIASSGSLCVELLEELNQLEFYQGESPKSLGYEFVVDLIFPLIDKYQLSIQDTLHTYVYHVVEQLYNKLEGKGTVLVTGGGAYNSYLIDLLNDRLGGVLVLPSKEIIEFKEALIFALLGFLRVHNKVNCLKSVTKAKKDHSSGRICMVY